MITIITIALAIPLWALAIVRRRQPRSARWLWLAAFVLFVAHIFAAYAEYYEWSHALAWQKTAEQVEAFFGVRSGFGLLVNYAFALILLIDLIRHFVGRKGSRWRWFVDGFVVFMILNGAIVFGSTISMVIGGLSLAVLFIGWIFKSRSRYATD